jgi:pimeloyl-ACP methyl ester carboxylesterase
LAISLSAASSGHGLEASSGTVRFIARDAVPITADFQPPGKGKPVFLLLHGLGAGRGEWSEFEKLLTRRGYGFLALDARGHGESGGERYDAFQRAEDWLALERDLEAGLAFLKKRGFPAGRVVLGGASIGANLALRMAARVPAVPFAVLFSPGYDYHGVLCEEALAGVSRPILIAAAPDDPYSWRTAQWAAARLRDPRGGTLKAASGHGVRMLQGRENRVFVRELMGRIDALVKTFFPVSSSGKRASP